MNSYATEEMSGSSYVPQSREPSFHHDLNNAGMTGALTSLLEAQGSRSLVHFPTRRSSDLDGGSSGPPLSYNGSPMTAGEFGAWTPIGAEKTATGYEVAWKVQIGSAHG